MPRFRLARLLAIAILGVISLGPVHGQVVQLTVLHTNDTHGHLLPFSFPEKYPPNSDLARLTVRRDIGGAARRGALVKKIRQEPNRHVLLADAGDICDGSPFSTEYHGDADIAVMNAIGYDVACPGNHEFSNPFSQVMKLATSANYPVVCANVIRVAHGKQAWTTHVFKKLGVLRVAVFGLTTPSGQSYLGAKDDVKILSPIDAARELVPRLRNEADLVVAVTHIGEDEDRKLAAAVPGIDVIVGGHSHTLLPRPVFIASRGASRSGSVNGTIIVQAHQYGGTLGRLDLQVGKTSDGGWAVTSYTGRLIPVTAAAGEDAKVAKVVDKYWAPIREKYGEVLAMAEDDFAEFGPDHAQYNLMADAMRSATSAQIHFENMGGVRAQLVKGPITLADVNTMDPFSNTLVRFQATGRVVKQILASIRPAVSGIRYRMASNRLLEATLGGTPIDDYAIYACSTNSFLAGGTMMKGVTDREDIGIPRKDALITYLRAAKRVTPAYDGRRVLRNMDNWGNSGR